MEEKKKTRESKLEKKRESAGDLNEGEKGKEGGGDRDTTFGEEIVLEKKKYGWNEKRNNIKNKISYLRNVTIIFS